MLSSTAVWFPHLAWVCPNIISNDCLIGLAGTVAALTYGLISFQRGNSRTQQHMMRLRVVAQGFTVVSVILGVAIMRWREPTKDAGNETSKSLR